LLIFFLSLSLFLFTHSSTIEIEIDPQLALIIVTKKKNKRKKEKRPFDAFDCSPSLLLVGCLSDRWSSLIPSTTRAPPSSSHARTTSATRSRLMASALALARLPCTCDRPWCSCLLSYLDASGCLTKPSAMGAKPHRFQPVYLVILRHWQDV
jgi:hypothetical protein